MATAEVGALRVSLSLDSAAFSAGTRAAQTSAQVAATGIATSFQAANTRVTASLATMGAAMQTQFRAGMMQQVGALRTGLLSLVSPIGLIVGAASYGLTALIGRQTEASEAAKLHADAVKALNDVMADARGRSSDYIQGRIDETARDLEGAQAALQLARARLAAAEAATAGVDPAAINIWDPAHGPALEGMVNLDSARAGLEAMTQAVTDFQTQLNALRGQQRRSWFLETILGEDLSGNSGGGSTADPAAAAVSKISDAQRAILDKVRDFEDQQTELVRQGEEQRRALREASLSSVASIFGSLAQIVGDGSERAFKISKMFSVGEAAINTGLAITKALAGPFPFITAAAVGAAGAAQIAGILRAQPGNSSVPSVPSAPTGAAGGGAAAAPPGGTMTIRGLNRGDLFTGDSVRELAEKLVEFQRNGGKVMYA